MPSEFLVEIAGISRDYHGLRPLRIEALTLAPRERIAILGLDQHMAETFVNLVTGAAVPDRGELKIFGRSTASITDSADWLALVDRFGIVSARAVLLDALSVIQNLSMPFTLEIEPPPDDIREQAIALARAVGFPEADWSKPVAELGENGVARARLARAVALNPDVLLLEHPSAGLSPRETTAFGETVRQIASKRDVAFVALTADKNFAAAVADRVLTLEPATGRLIDSRSGWLGRLLRP